MQWKCSRIASGSLKTLMFHVETIPGQFDPDLPLVFLSSRTIGLPEFPDSHALGEDFLGFTPSREKVVAHPFLLLWPRQAGLVLEPHKW